MNDIDILNECYFQNPFIGITVCDKDGVCIDVNDAQIKIVGIPKEDIVGKCLNEIVAENKLSSSATMEVLKNKAEVNMSQTSISGRSYDVKAVPVLDDKDNIEYVINYIMDSTAINKYRKEVHRLEKNAIDNSQLIQLLSSSADYKSFVFDSEIMKEKSELAKRIAPSDATVLITGPSGAGKELIADLIHENSNRKEKPYIKLNCAALPEHLLESELFGYEAGAFTGGRKEGNIGLFESADGGTLLLDEIAEMPVSLQAKILRVIQDQEVRRIGGDQSVKVDVRFIALTNATLSERIKEGKFREDLYYRLNVISIYIPGLSKRKDDIPGLVVFFLVSFNKKYGMNKRIMPEVVGYLQSISYPGNVRELNNLMERIILQSKTDIITLREAMEICRGCNDEQYEEDNVLLTRSEDMSLKYAMEDYERRLLKEYMDRYNKTTVVADRLGIDRSTLTRKIKKYKLG